MIFRLYFLCGALLSLGAYAAFWASFGAWTWAVLLPAMVLVRPLAAHACGIINENLGLGVTMIMRFFSSSCAAKVSGLCQCWRRRESLAPQRAVRL